MQTLIGVKEIRDKIFYNVELEYMFTTYIIEIRTVSGLKNDTTKSDCLVSQFFKQLGCHFRNFGNRTDDTPGSFLRGLKLRPDFFGFFEKYLQDSIGLEVIREICIKDFLETIYCRRTSVPKMMKRSPLSVLKVDDILNIFNKTIIPKLRIEFLESFEIGV